jgi:hypothetical protein
VGEKEMHRSSRRLTLVDEYVRRKPYVVAQNDADNCQCLTCYLVVESRLVLVIAYFAVYFVFRKAAVAVKRIVCTLGKPARDCIYTQKQHGAAQ